MTKISIKQNKKGTFLDLSKEDFEADSFIKNFNDYSDEISSFLSGTAVGLILPKTFNQELKRSQELLSEIKTALNKKNISLRHALSNELEPNLETILEPRSESREVVDVSDLPETLYVEANLRSGQLIRYPGNVFVLGDVNPSSEIIANGDIIVWGTLRGIAHAGADGNVDAKIVAINLESGQIRIANKIASLTIKSKKKRKKDGSVIPELVKIENGEIIVRRYYK